MDNLICYFLNTAYLKVPDPTVQKPEAPAAAPAAATPAATPTPKTAAAPVAPAPVPVPAKAGVVTTGPAAPSPNGYKVASKHIAPKIQSGYTLQLYNSYNKNDAINFIVRNNLRDKAAFYKTRFLNRDKYIVIYGAYKTPAQALNVIQSLPPEIQKWNPTVKPISKVQQEMQN